MNFTLEKLKEARDAGISDDIIWQTAIEGDERFSTLKEKNVPLDIAFQAYQESLSENEPERREGGGIVGGAADIGIQFMKGLGTGTRMISDVFGANNPVSKSIAGYEDYFDSLLSAESKQDSQEISRILKEAEGKGILPQIMAGLEAFTVAPAEMTASTMGMMLPNLAGGVYSKAAQLTKAGVIGLQMGIGAAQGAGSIKGQIYTAVQEELRRQGLPEDKIDDIATEAQAYNGKNLDQILIGAGLGAAASSTGAEKIMTRLITGAGKEASEGLIKAVIKGGFSEAPIEGLQGGQEKIAENVALQRIGVDVPTMQGVIPAATMEATAGLVIGGGFGGVEALTSPEQNEEKKIDKQSNQVANELLAENTPATQSVVKELARRENAVTNLQEAYDTLEPTSQEAQKLKLELSEAQRNLSAFKEVANKAGLSEPITEAEKQQIELAKAITEPAPEIPAPVTEAITPLAEVAPAAPVAEVAPAPTEVTPEAETQLIDIESKIRKPDGNLPTWYKNAIINIDGEAGPGWTNADVFVDELGQIGINKENAIKIIEEIRQKDKQRAFEATKIANDPVELLATAPTGASQSFDSITKEQQDQLNVLKEANLVTTTERNGKTFWKRIGDIKEWQLKQQKKPTPEAPAITPAEKTYAQLENEAIDIQNKINEEEGVSALIGVSDNAITLSGLESREKGKGTRALEIITQEADKNNTPISLKAESKTGETQRLKEFYMRFGFVNDPSFSPESNRMIRYPNATPAITPAPTPTEPAPTEDIIGKKVTDSMGALPQKAGKARQALQGYIPVFKIGDFYEFIGEDAALSGSTIVGSGKSARSSLPYHQTSKFQEIANKTGKPIAIISNTKVSEVINPITPAPVEEAEFAELNDLMERRGQAQGKVKGVKFSKKDEARYNELLPKYRSQLLETITPETDPVVWKDIEGNDIKVSQKGTFYTVENGRVRTGPAFQSEGFIKDVSPQPVSAVVVESNNVPLPEGYTKQGDLYVYQPTPAVSETITPAEPEGISAGNRIKLGKSPQTYIVEEAIPQTEAEKANNEQFYSVKNERTGETQVVEQADMKQVGGKKVRKMAVEVIPKQESVTPIPEANRYTFEEAVKAVDAHFGKKGIPEGVVIVNNTTEPDLEMKAGYFVNRGQIVINLAYIAKGENLGDIIDHELGHYIFGDPKFQADFKKFWELMTPEEKAKADQIINQFYNKETGAVQIEEKQVRAFMQLIQDSKAMPKWKQLLDKIKRWINEKLGTNLQVTDRGALAVLAAAHKRFKSGEQIVREIDSGVLKTAETAQDAEYLAAVERGDMETAQRMVDEAAKRAGYDIKAIHGTPTEERIDVFGRRGELTGMRSAQKAFFFSDSQDVANTYRFQNRPAPNESIVNQWIDGLSDDQVSMIIPSEWGISKDDAAWMRSSVKDKALNFTNEIGEDIYYAIDDLIDYAKLNNIPYPSELDQETIGQTIPVVLNIKNPYRFTYDEFESDGINEIVDRAIDGGFDGGISSERIPDAYAGSDNKNPPSGIIKFVFDPSQIKSADPVTYDDAGNVIPLSQRFQPSEPDIRRMAVEPSGERQQIMGEKIGPLKKTPEGIIAETQAKLRERFDPTKVTEQNTTEAFRALGRLTGKDGAAFAQELNDIGRMVDESGAAAEVSMGAALFVNDLFEYAVRLAAQGQKMMLGIMMTNINKLPTGTEGRSDAGRALRAAREMKDTFLTMAKAEQDAFINYAAEFVYGPNPTKQQVDSIKIGYDAVEKVQEPTAKEVEEEIAAVGEKTGTDLVGRINDEFTKATEKGKAKRKTESEDLDAEYKKVQMKAESEIEKLAKIQSDTPAFARQVVNEIRAIIANDLKQRPDMESKAQWKSALVDKLQNAGVEPSRAERLADLVWRQHEINNLSREIDSINKAVEKGPISEIIKAIKETPLEQQQNPNWRYEVMRDYLRKAGLSVAQAERIAKLMDISLQKRFTQAKEQAFTDAISKTAPWKAGDVRSKRAFQQVIQAIRAGALDPSRNMASDIAAMNGWTGFTADQYKNLLKFDAILANEDSKDIQKAEAYKAIQDIISKSKLPIRARDVIGQYYDAQALSGIPTLTVNSFSPIAFAMRNAIVQAGSGTIKGDAKAIGRAATAFVDSIKSWANTVAFSFKNNVTVYSNVDYIVNDDNLLRLYRKGVDQFTKSKNTKERADGVKNMMIGMMDYVRRILNALDYGAIASLQNQNISKYAMAVMKRQKMNDKQANEMFGVMMKAKNDFYLQQIAIGTDKNKAGILADEFYISSWKEALSKAGVEKSDIQQAMDAAINDALSSVGRNRQSLDAFKEEDTKLKDAGVSSMPALWLLESVANAANRSDNQVVKLFSRVIYGFAIVPARVIRETAWFSPYGFVRFGYDWTAKKMGKTSPYAQSLGTDVQYSQRLAEATAGTVALLGLMALRSGSTDDPEDEDEFKIVFTGNGPQRKDDAQFYDSWYKAGNKPNSMIVSFGKTKFTLNMMRGFEAFTWPAMMLGAIDDLEIRKKQKQQTKTPAQLEDAAIVAGFVFDAALRRGPYAFTTKSLFGTYGDIGVEGVAKGLTFPAKTLIPVLGTSLASNLSNFLNDPIDRRTLDGAVWSNIPFIGPAVAPKSLNAFGEPSLSTDLASKMFKLGVPIVYDIPTDRESIKLHELVLKQGGGPSIPTRNQLAQRLDRQPTNKEYEMFVREYGTILTTSMKKNYDKLFNAKPEFYSRAVERIGLRARDVAENKVRQAAKKP